MPPGNGRAQVLFLELFMHFPGPLISPEEELADEPADCAIGC